MPILLLCHGAPISGTRSHPGHGKVSDPHDAAEPIEARLAALERQTEWLSVELARLRAVLESVASVAREALLFDPEE